MLALSQILDHADEDRWQKAFQEKREILLRMEQEALEEDRQGLARPLEELLDSIPHDSYNRLT